MPPGAPSVEDGYALSLRWVASQPSRTFQGIFAVNTARNWDEFTAAARLVDVPAQGLVYADRSGHIGFAASGRIPVRGAGDGTLPAPGWDSSYDWQGFVPAEDLPTAFDPADGYLVAANQAVLDPRGDGPFLGADSDYGYRSQRINDLLALAVSTGDIDVETTRQLQNDDLNPFAATLLPYLRDIDGLDEATLEAMALFDDWDERQPVDSAAAAYYNAVWAEVLTRTFTDELPEDTWPGGDGRWFVVMTSLLENPDSDWWDDVDTADVVETRDSILRDALVGAREEVVGRLGDDPESWRWGELHRLQARHPALGADEVPWPVRNLFNADQVPLAGGTAAVNATSWWASGDSFDSSSVPSTRLVVDLGDFDQSRWVDLTGVSEHPRDAYHGNQLDAWSQGELYPWPFTREAVAEATGDRLLLQPPTPTP